MEPIGYRNDFFPRNWTKFCFHKTYIVQYMILWNLAYLALITYLNSSSLKQAVSFIKSKSTFF